MANPQFTPGPWHRETSPHSHLQTIRSNDGLLIGQVYHTAYNDDRQAQNAYLIAAAPELYESGCELRQAMHDYMVIPNREVADAITKFDAALTKAEGESNA